ncbi:hypothetical protein [Deinococcus cellulosilyticus]|uniref:Uncharacterized protein n=1 Tax=Deinococcus cellulosilyticus (strain DSM 18568 / NBRC 106333 / KACC 11606 / 5516J-15) TaxID=1223518 RepID=A0A511NAA8_DEIC1|nr:hypothetical protein [Deinococcus cellulosilyticus]GEM49759.1 hypothetical protein DC3_53940 [Deinococcus cellulosilyticus NBRC 106333 = KACC 11606]
MDLIYSHPRFPLPTPQRTDQCKVDVYADDDRHQVTVMFRLPRPSHKLDCDMYRVINAFYREALFRHLTPASSLKFYCVDSTGEHQHVQLEGLPGGYTGGQLMPCLSLPLPAVSSSMTA